jgi:hypothetical protein
MQASVCERLPKTWRDASCPIGLGPGAGLVWSDPRPYNLSRKTIEKAINAHGFHLWRLQPKAVKSE